MNKLFTKIVGACLGLTMAVGVGVAVAGGSKEANRVDAADTEIVSFTSIGAGLTSTSASGTIAITATGTTDSYTFNYGSAKKQGSAALLAKGSGGGTSFFSNKTAMPGNIVSVKVYINSGAAADATYHCAFKTTECTSRYVTGSTAVKIGAGKNHTYSCSVSGAKYFCVALGNNNNGQVLGFDITYEVAAGPTVTVASSLNLTAGGSSSTIQATTENITDATFSWSRTAGDDCVTLTNTTSATVTVAPKGTTFASCTLTLTVNGKNGGTAITPIAKTVTVSVNKSPTQANPYTVAEAKYAIDNNKTKTDVYVTGIVSKVDSFASGAITYWLSDDGTTTSQQFEVYKGKNANAANFTDINDVLVGDVVVVYGTITLYGTSTYEFNSGSSRVSYSRVTISGIAVKISPSKTAYISGQSFDATGLVITVTYSDSNTEDVAYSGNENKFTFNPTAITSSGNVTITYGGQTCNQAVTLLTVKAVTGVHSKPDYVYKNGSIQGSEVELDVLYSDDTTVGVVNADHVNVDTSAVAASVVATAWYTASETDDTKKATFNVEVKKVPAYIDIVDKLELIDFDATSTTYVDTTNIAKSSDARYYANTNNPSDSDDTTGKRFSLRTTNNNSGVVSTTSGGLIKKVTINEVYYSASGTRTLDVYGSNTAYTSPADLFDENKQGTKLASLTSSTNEYTFTADYEYVGVRSSSGAIMMQYVQFTWKVEDAEYPLTANPTLSTGASASVSVGKNLTLTVTTTPAESDEKLIVTSDDPTKATVSGSNKVYTIHGVAEGSATITVAGAKGTYKSTVVVTVSAAVKSFEDKIITPSAINVTGASYADNDEASHEDDGVSYTTKDVQLNGGAFQFKKNAGYLQNSEVFYTASSVDAKIKAITLFMNEDNQGTVTVYEGNTSTPSTAVPVTTTTGDVRTYVFSSGMTYFKIAETGNSYVLKIDKFVVELADDTDATLTHARTAASTILNALKNTCGSGNSGVVTQSQWDSLNASLTALNLTDAEKEFLKNAQRLSLDNLSQGGATIENAMAHYDACVTKFGFTPFAGITAAQANPHAIPSLINIANNGNTVAIIVVISMISVTAVGGYFLLRRRKEVK